MNNRVCNELPVAFYSCDYLTSSLILSMSTVRGRQRSSETQTDTHTHTYFDTHEPQAHQHFQTETQTAHGESKNERLGADCNTMSGAVKLCLKPRTSPAWPPMTYRLPLQEMRALSGTN